MVTEGTLSCLSVNVTTLTSRIGGGKESRDVEKGSSECGAGRESIDLLGEIRGLVRSNGDVLRYNTRTNEFAVGAADGTIRTLFRPADGLDYWLRATQ